MTYYQKRKFNITNHAFTRGQERLKLDLNLSKILIEHTIYQIIDQSINCDFPTYTSKHGYYYLIHPNFWKKNNQKIYVLLSKDEKTVISITYEPKI